VSLYASAAQAFVRPGSKGAWKLVQCNYSLLQGRVHDVDQPKRTPGVQGVTFGSGQVASRSGIPRLFANHEY
jgi:hypothetical protein